MIKTRRKIRPIARKRYNFLYLLFAILFAISTGYIFVNFSPNHKFELSNFEIPILPIFLTSLSVFVFSFITFLLKRKLQGIIVFSFILFYLVIRLIGLTHWLFGVLIIALFITVELFILKKK
ncbi:MAG: hypothetical protein HY426_03720 [Candidatus Levybacteria bacterium]|nr:hypothetical protein [Candidatus Levybacteria bacterium]